MGAADQPLGRMTHRVARTLLQLEGWQGFKALGAATGLYREHISYHLNMLYRQRMVERRKSTIESRAYEFRLSGAGIKFALAHEPGNTVISAQPHYDHRHLSEALGMARRILPPTGGRIHLLGGRYE